MMGETGRESPPKAGTEKGKEVEIETVTGTKIRTESEKGTEVEMGKGIRTKKGMVIETRIVIVITETATGIVVREGRGPEIGMMLMMTITEAETVIGEETANCSMFFH